jgi:hypothetical protein
VAAAIGALPDWPYVPCGARLVSHDNAAIELALAPIRPAAGQLVAGLERADVLLAIAGGLGIQRTDDLCAVSAVAGPMRHPGVRAAETMRRPVRIVAFVPGITDQDQLVTDVAGRKLGVAAATIVERLSGCAGEAAAGAEGDGHG